MKKKLVYVVTKSSWGGAQRYVYDLAESFKNDFDVEIWCGDNELGTSISLFEKATAAGIYVRRIDGLGRDIRFFDEFRVWRSLSLLIKIHKPDILHLNSTKAGLMGAIVGKANRVKKIIFTAHGLANFEDRPIWQKILISMSNRAIFALVDNVVLLSKMELEYTKKWYRSHRHKLVHNGISPLNEQPLSDILSELPISIRERLCTNETKKFVGIGELHKNKGTTFTLQALHKLITAGEKVVYIHFGDGELMDELNKCVCRLKLQDSVFFWGFKENAAVYLSHFDALVFPSIKEGLPYVVVEASYAGITTFASRVGGIPEIISEGLNGKLHEPKDVETLAKHLRDFNKTEDVNSEKIRSRAQDKFSISKMCSAMRSIYMD